MLLDGFSPCAQVAFPPLLCWFFFLVLLLLSFFSAELLLRAQILLVVFFFFLFFLPPPLFSLLLFFPYPVGKRCFHASEPHGAFDTGHTRASFHLLRAAGAMFCLSGERSLLAADPWEKLLISASCRASSSTDVN